MPQETKAHGGERPQWEGRSFRPADDRELHDLIEAAFDYRGDVTLELKDGVRIEGYVFSRDARAGDPVLRMFPKDEPDTQVIRYGDIAAITFTGEDTAFGKSWEAWTTKSEELREADAERMRADAEARGDL
jgi:transcriptional antiterminator Rof (Rho-off)